MTFHHTCKCFNIGLFILKIFEGNSQKFHNPIPMMTAKHFYFIIDSFKFTSVVL